MHDQVRDDLGIGLRFEHEPGLLQLHAQRGVVLDDAVVHHADSLRSVRMCVVFTGHAVGGPARVRHAAKAGQRRRLLSRFERGNLALGAQAAHTGVGEHGDASGIVAAILQRFEPGNEVLNDVALRADANDATHEMVPFRQGDQFSAATCFPAGN